MTVIAWDGTTLAADKMITNSVQHSTATKIWKRNGYLIGGSGNTVQILEMVEWFVNGAHPHKFPELQKNQDESCNLLVICPDKKILEFEHTACPIVIENPFYAIGSGASFALAAMYLGKTSKEAVKVANALSPSCGNGINTLRF